MQGAIEGAAQGITSVGLNYLVEEMDINPLLANIGFSAISTAINSTLQSFAPTGEKDVFKHIYETYRDNTLTFLGVGDPADPSYVWQQAAYMAQIQDFTKIITEQGLESALNTYATGFFNSTAVNSIVSTGVTIGGYFKEKLNAGNYTIETKDDKKYAKVAIEDAQSNKTGEAYFGWLEETQGWDDFIGTTETDENGIDMYRWGDLYKDVNDDVGYYGYSELYNQWGDLGVFQTIQDGCQKYVEIKDNAGNVLFIAEPTVEGGYNYYNDLGEYLDVKVKDVMGDSIFSLSEGAIDDFVFSEPTINSAEKNTVSVDGEGKVDLDFSQETLNEIFGDDTGEDVAGQGIINKIQDWVATLGDKIQEPVQQIEKTFNDFDGVIGDVIADEGIKASISDRVHEFVKNTGIIPNIEVVYVKNPATIFRLSDNVSIKYTDEASVKLKGNSALSLKIDGLTGLIIGTEAKGELGNDNFTANIFANVKQDYGFGPTIQGGAGITWVTDTNLEVGQSVQAEFLKDVNEDGYMTWGYEHELSAGSATSSRTFEISTKNNVYKGVAVGLGVTAIVITATSLLGGLEVAGSSAAIQALRAAVSSALAFGS